MSRKTVPDIHYTEALGDEIVTRLAEGESLRSICRDKHIPSKSNVLLWVVDGKHEDFSAKYRRAREAAGHSHADETIDIVRELRDGKLDHQTASVMARNLQWAAERMAGGHYASKARMEHTGKDGESLSIQIVKYGDDQATQ